MASQKYWGKWPNQAAPWNQHRGEIHWFEASSTNNLIFYPLEFVQTVSLLKVGVLEAISSYLLSCVATGSVFYHFLDITNT